MGSLLAVTRPVSPSFAQCELTHLAREPIDVALAVAQHAAYERLLHSLGLAIVRVAAAPELPDAVFVEDTAVGLGELARVTPPRAPPPPGGAAAAPPPLAGDRPPGPMGAPAAP